MSNEQEAGTASEFTASDLEQQKEITRFLSSLLEEVDLNVQGIKIIKVSIDDVTPGPEARKENSSKCLANHLAKENTALRNANNCLRKRLEEIEENSQFMIAQLAAAMEHILEMSGGYENRWVPHPDDCDPNKTYTKKEAGICWRARILAEAILGTVGTPLPSPGPCNRRSAA